MKTLACLSSLALLSIAAGSTLATEDVLAAKNAEAPPREALTSPLPPTASQAGEPATCFSSIEQRGIKGLRLGLSLAASPSREAPPAEWVECSKAQLGQVNWVVTNVCCCSNQRWLEQKWVCTHVHGVGGGKEVWLYAGSFCWGQLCESNCPV